MKKTDKPIIVEETYDAEPASVWAAITEPQQMRKWFFENIPAFEPRVGFSVEFNVDTGGRTFPHLWRITKVVPGKLIKYNWKYGGYEGDSYVTFDLKPLKDSTKLRLTHIIVEDFQEGIPEFERESCIGGWKYYIQQRLKEYLETR